MGAETADQYESLVAQHILSVQLSKAEHDQRHNLFQTRGVVKERAIWIIIDGGSCNNLASLDMVEKLALPTQQRPHPYYIQWFESSRKLKVTRTARVHLLLVPIQILLIVMLYLCKLVLCYLVDHGNLIENLYIMVKLISTLLHMLARKLDLNP
jgi:hypothetical protein